TWFNPKLVKRISLPFPICKIPEYADKIYVDEMQLREPVRTEGGDVYDYEDSKFIKLVTWVLTLLSAMPASLLPTLIILWLFHVKRTVVRIWITVACTVGIGLFLRVFNNASMKEIFGGTAAYGLAFFSGLMQKLTTETDSLQSRLFSLAVPTALTLGREDFS